jgi:hypothetical protein
MIDLLMGDRRKAPYAFLLLLCSCGVTVVGGATTGSPDSGASSNDPSSRENPADGDASATPDALDANPPNANGCAPTPIFGVTFAGGIVTTKGAVASTGALATTGAYPAFSTNVAGGPRAPTGNSSAIDFGHVGGGDGSRAIDLDPATAKATENVQAFTITAWVNVRSIETGPGGNRIFSTHIQGSQGGIDLVQDQAALRMGVNQYADEGNPPRSSTKLRIESATSASNWMFIAVTYNAGGEDAGADGTVAFFFGDGQTDASLDVSLPYDQGIVRAPSQTKLTLGNFAVDTARTAKGGASRILRGLLDELAFFDHALSLDEIRCQQRSAGE